MRRTVLRADLCGLVCQAQSPRASACVECEVSVPYPVPEVFCSSCPRTRGSQGVNGVRCAQLLVLEVKGERDQVPSTAPRCVLAGSGSPPS